MSGQTIISQRNVGLEEPIANWPKCTEDRSPSKTRLGGRGKKVQPVACQARGHSLLGRGLSSGTHVYHPPSLSTTRSPSLLQLAFFLPVFFIVPPTTPYPTRSAPIVISGGIGGNNLRRWRQRRPPQRLWQWNDAIRQRRGCYLLMVFACNHFHIHAFLFSILSVISSIHCSALET